MENPTNEKPEEAPMKASIPNVKMDMKDLGYRSAKAYLDAISRSDPEFVKGFMQAMREAVEK